MNQHFSYIRMLEYLKQHILLGGKVDLNHSLITLPLNDGGSLWEIP